MLNIGAKMRNYFEHCFALPAFVWCLVSPPAQLSRRVRGIAPSGTFAPVAGSASWSTYSGAGGSSWSDPCHYSPWTSQSPGSINVANDTKTFQSPNKIKMDSFLVNLCVCLFTMKIKHNFSIYDELWIQSSKVFALPWGLAHCNDLNHSPQLLWECSLLYSELR